MTVRPNGKPPTTSGGAAGDRKEAESDRKAAESDRIQADVDRLHAARDHDAW